MDPTFDATPGWAPTPVPLPPPFLPAVAAPALKPMPLWAGLLITVVGFLFAIFTLAATGGSLHLIYWLFALPGLVFYLLAIRRFFVVLEVQPGWQAEYTPGSTIWRQLIPLYGTFFLYQWTGDIESYLHWRLGLRARVGLFAFLAAFIGFLTARFVDTFIGQLIYIAALYFVDIPLRRALRTPPPGDTMSPRYDGSLGLT